MTGTPPSGQATCPLPASPRMADRLSMPKDALMPPLPAPRLVRSRGGTPPPGARLADFITASIEPIVAEWEAFARTQSSATRLLDAAELRDHAAQILAAIVADLRLPQTSQQQVAKSKGLAPAADPVSLTAAQVHAMLRVRSGFNVNQMASEYRALRASVLRLWFAVVPKLRPDDIDDLVRFNEAIDQAVAESVAVFTAEINRWRHLFLGVLGHDLRSPLNAILLTSELPARLASDTPAAQYTQSLIRSGERTKALLLHQGQPTTRRSTPARSPPRRWSSALHDCSSD